MVFFYTTSIYFEGEGGRESGRRGHSIDTIRKLESGEINITYILGVRMRKDKELSDQSFDTDSFMEVAPPKQTKKDPVPADRSSRLLFGSSESRRRCGASRFSKIATPLKNT